MHESYSVSPRVQPVQMVGRLISTYEPSGTEFLLAIAASSQRAVEAIDQGVSGERLGQEAGRSRLQGPQPGAFGGKGRDENEGQPVSAGLQVGLQFEAAHRRHLDIRDHARGVIQLRGVQKFLG